MISAVGSVIKSSGLHSTKFLRGQPRRGKIMNEVFVCKCGCKNFMISDYEIKCSECGFIGSFDNDAFRQEVINADIFHGFDTCSFNAFFGIDSLEGDK